ncbi:MAG: hypothetical protein M1820_001041 [Bogoriella megaspora]|nr:MAG: hypothetical protein M1820_001041 [Bogoriella megaspora]
MLMLSACLYVLIETCSGRPVLRRDNGDDPATVGWVSDPDGRGTSGLIISCLLTLGLCVWNVMHLNIPPKGETKVQYWLRSLKWVALGVLVPELVILSAWRQWLSARRMSKELNKIFKEQNDGKSAFRRFEWTISHSYFAGMGGFVFEKEFLPQGEKTLFNAPERLTLTASGVLLLARCGHLPDVHRDVIWDKSKADGLAKTVVCVQAAWMIVQIGGRLVVHEPVTLLEVNTLGHIFCAFIIYVLWWKKPKEVNAPISLEGPWTEQLAAFMYMSSRISGQKPSGRIKLPQWIKPELSELAWYPSTSSPDHVSASPRDESEVPPIEEEVPNIATKWSDGELRKRPEHTITALPATVIKPSLSTGHSDDLTRQARLDACTEAITTYPAIQNLFHHPSEDCPWLKPEVVHLATDVATNWPSDYYLPGISGELMGMALWLSSSLYGGIHIAAWSEYFPTAAERFLWHFSSLYIAASGAFWLLLCVIAFRWPWASSYWDRFIELRAWKLEYAVLGLVSTVCGLAYIFARVFLVVDAVISLRRLPSGAYETPDWTTIFPHL